MLSLWRLFLLTCFGCLLPLSLIGCGDGDDAVTEDPAEAAPIEDVPPP